MQSVFRAVVATVVLTQLAIFVTTVYLHRALSHRSIRLAPATNLAFRVLTWLTTGIRPREWVAVHRKHHAFTDVPGDPHSPLLEGFAMVQLGNVVLYRRALRDPALVPRYARDLRPDRWDRAVFDHGFVGLALGVGLLWLAFGPWVALAVGLSHAVAYLLLNAAINAVGHWRGSQPHPNTSRNNQWLAWLTAGEGLHNNHHAAPTSARLALTPGEIDPGWWLVRALTALRLATVRHAGVRLEPAA